MSAAVANGSHTQSRNQNRDERRKEWWSKNKEFRSKLRDRNTLHKKENEQQMLQTVAPKVDTSRGFRASTVVSRMSSAAAPTSRMSGAAPTSRMSGGAPKKSSASFAAAKKKLTVSAAHLKTKGSNEKGPNNVARNKAKSVPKSAGKTKVLDKVAVTETILAKPEMSEISLNAKGVELTNLANHINQRYILFIGNLPYTIDKGQLMSHFRKAGGVKSIRIPKHKSGLGKGFAYIEFKDRIGQGIALRLHHTTLAGRKINVEFSSDEKKKYPDPETS